MTSLDHIGAELNALEVPGNAAEKAARLLALGEERSGLFEHRVCTHAMVDEVEHTPVATGEIQQLSSVRARQRVTGNYGRCCRHSR